MNFRGNGFKAQMQVVTMLSLVAVLPSSHAETLLKDNFDGDPYSDNAPLVVGPNQIPNGLWSLNNKDQGAVTTSTEASLSPHRSMALICSGSGDQAQAVARFSVDGNETSTAQALTAKFSFCLPEPGTEVVVVVRSKTEDNLVTLTIRASGPVKVAFADRVVDLGGVEPGKWYQVALGLPANPGTEGGEYSAALLDAKDHTEIDAVSGLLGKSEGPTEYRYLSVYQHSTQDAPSAAYFDDFSVESLP